MDVYTGALSEPPMPGSIVGPLLSCLITDQFLRLKRGDSHWYERRRGPQRFTEGKFQQSHCKASTRLNGLTSRCLFTDQLHQIYGTTLASIICRNSDSVEQSRRFVMREMDEENTMQKCHEIDTFKFDAWKEDESRKNVHSVKMSNQQTNARIMTKDTRH